MSAPDAVLAGRQAAESLMVDACTIRRQVGTVTDPVSGAVSPSWSVVYEGPCKVQQTISQASSPVAGGHSFTVQDTRVDLPVAAGPVAIDDQVTMTGSLLDAQLVGRVFRVSELFHKSMATAQRTRVEEVVA